MKLTYYGHACFSVVVAGRTLLFDPFISPNPLANEIVDIEQVPADFILVSHGHFDHIEDVAAIAKRTNAKVLANFEVGQWLMNKKELKEVNCLNLGGSCQYDFGRVQYVNAVHSSSLPDGSYGGNPGGYVVDSGEGAFYYSGDTGLTFDMKLIPGSTSSPIEFLVLPIGDQFTMGVDEALRAADFLGCNRVVGVHYDTFPPIKIDHQKAIQKFKAAGKELLLPAIGQTITL